MFYFVLSLMLIVPVLPAFSDQESTNTDRAIQLFETRVKEDPRDYISLTTLGQLYNRKARDTGDLSSYQTAERSFRKAVELKADYLPAMNDLAFTLVSQHKFTEALELVTQIYEKNPSNIESIATMGDAHLELGNYEQAENAYAELKRKTSKDQPAVLARLARMAELKGKNEEAFRLIQRAAEIVRKEAGLPEDLAWYQYRLGDLCFHTGQLHAAENHFQAALKISDRYYSALAGLAEVRKAQGRKDEAIAMYEQILRVNQSPSVLIDLGDLYAETANQQQAEPHYKRAEELALKDGINRYLYNREMTYFYSDHDRNLSEALNLAKEELNLRKDVHGYDALGWALYKNNRLSEAADAIQEAMKLGTKEPDFFYHAAMIYYKLGEKKKALHYLQELHSLAPYLVPEDVKTIF